MISTESFTYDWAGNIVRETEETSYYDIGFSDGIAAAFVIGFHFNYSVSISGIAMDLYEYYTTSLPER